jgi:hypothetical protein
LVPDPAEVSSAGGSGSAVVLSSELLELLDDEPQPAIANTAINARSTAGSAIQRFMRVPFNPGECGTLSHDCQIVKQC